MTTEELNSIVLRMMSVYLNEYADYIDSEMMSEMVPVCGGDSTYAYRLLLSSALGTDDRSRYNGMGEAIERLYLPEMIHRLDTGDFNDDMYLKNIVFPNVKNDSWEFGFQSYKPYEAFVFDDFRKDFAGRLFPQIGFFGSEFRYPCVKQDGREWMTVTPNEINTMREPIAEAHGDVLTYGLGLGYFTYMVQRKADVTSVTVVEKDERVIELFSDCILGQFENREKIKIICDDAFDYARHEKGHDYIFCDIWHDASDGLDMWIKMKLLERKDAEYSYWLEKTMKEYL